MMAHKDIIRTTAPQTDPLLLKAQPLLKAYTRATGALVCTMDRFYISIPEIFDEITTEKNTCLFCMKYQLNFIINKNEDFDFHPCRELHITGMKKAVETGGSYCYTCDLGFMFWASPICADRHLIGSFIGSGFLVMDREEAAKKMTDRGYSEEARMGLMKRLSLFFRVEPEYVKALSELMLVCAESISPDSGDYYAALIRRGGQQKEFNLILESLKEKYPVNVSPPEYPSDKEDAFFEAIRRGDIKKGSSLLNEILAVLFFTYPKCFHHIHYRILELAILLGRTENTCSCPSNTFSPATLQFLKAVEDANTPEELIDAIHLMSQYLASEALSFRGIRHASAMKKADLFIQSNFTRKLSLEEIAEVSGLSAPYFSTIFKEEMGENLCSYLNRLRMEKACHMLMETNFPLSKIADFCGFEDQSWFSKIFKTYSGMNPGKYRQLKRNSFTEIPESTVSEDYRSLVKK